MDNRVFLKISPVIVTLAMGAFLGVAATLHHYRENSLRIEELKSENQQLQLVNTQLGADLEHLEFIADMASQFGLSPNIVEIVHQESREVVDPTQPKWRLIQTPEFMTYLMLSIIYAESKGNPAAVGDGGRARGLTQIWLSTARQYGEVNAEALLDPATNLRFAFDHFAYLLDRYKGNLALTLYAWNRGEGTIDKLLSYGELPVNGYGLKIYQAAVSAGRPGE